jgi:hypothetical protein
MKKIDEYLEIFPKFKVNVAVPAALGEYAVIVCTVCATVVLPVTFKFKLLGMNNQDSKEWQEYQRLKEKFNAA